MAKISLSLGSFYDKRCGRIKFEGAIRKRKMFRLGDYNMPLQGNCVLEKLGYCNASCRTEKDFYDVLQGGSKLELAWKILRCQYKQHRFYMALRGVCALLGEIESCDATHNARNKFLLYQVRSHFVFRSVLYIEWCSERPSR